MEQCCTSQQWCIQWTTVKVGNASKLHELQCLVNKKQSTVAASHNTSLRSQPDQTWWPSAATLTPPVTDQDLYLQHTAQPQHHTHKSYALLWQPVHQALNTEGQTARISLFLSPLYTVYNYFVQLLSVLETHQPPRQCLTTTWKLQFSSCLKENVSLPAWKTPLNCLCLLFWKCFYFTFKKETKSWLLSLLGSMNITHIKTKTFFPT